MYESTKADLIMQDHVKENEPDIFSRNLLHVIEGLNQIPASRSSIEFSFWIILIWRPSWQESLIKNTVCHYTLGYIFLDKTKTR